jgi:hypothetical protein
MSRIQGPMSTGSRKNMTAAMQKEATETMARTMANRHGRMHTNRGSGHAGPATTGRESTTPTTHHAPREGGKTDRRQKEGRQDGARSTEMRPADRGVIAMPDWPTYQHYQLPATRGLISRRRIKTSNSAVSQNSMKQRGRRRRATRISYIILQRRPALGPWPREEHACADLLRSTEGPASDAVTQLKATKAPATQPRTRAHAHPIHPHSRTRTPHWQWQ